jgi:pimeloyl-ACP methyl ester carboxylesterase
LVGRQAVALAAHAPARVRGLVLLAPPSTEIAGDGGWLAPALRRLDPGPFLWLGLGSVYADPGLAMPEVRARYRYLLLAPGVRDAILERGRRGIPGASAPAAPPPTLLVWGSEDRIVPPSVSAAWGRLLPDARFVVLPGMGHLPMEEVPGVLADLLRVEAAPR